MRAPRSVRNSYPPPIRCVVFSEPPYHGASLISAVLSIDRISRIRRFSGISRSVRTTEIIMGGSEEDRISALPDHLIHQILSFLELKQVIATSALSTRWRFLWTSVPTLDLGNWAYETGQNIPTQISLSLMNYASPKIRKFCAHFDFANIKQWHVDDWVGFATKRDVEEFDLSLIDDSCWEDRDLEELHDFKFKLLECLLSCESLKILKLSFFQLNLHSLTLRMLTDTSGCPLLESLILIDCNPDEPLNIHVPNPNLRYLKINDSFAIDSITLFAPNLQSIHFEGNIREAYNINNLSSLRVASFKFEENMVDVSEPSSVVDLFQGVLHASTIRLNHGFMKALSLLEAGVALPQIRTTYLELEINMQKADLIGMALVLSSANSLETLKLDISSFTKVYFKDRHLDDLDIDDLWRQLWCSVSTIRSLNNIEVNNILGSGSGSNEPITNLNINEKWVKEIKVVMILLASCTTLETMTIKIDPSPVKSQLLLFLTERLLTFPKASKNAEIYIT